MNSTNGQLHVGATAIHTWHVKPEDIDGYADLTGDKQLVHLDDVYAQQTPFGERIAHGMLTAGFISRVLGMELPGEGTIYREQTLRFTAPVKIDDKITVKVKVIAVDTKTYRWARLTTHCWNQDGTVVLTGEALVNPPKH